MNKKIISTLWMTAIISFILFIVSTQVVEAKSYQVGTSQLNIRSAPDMAAEVVGGLTAGETIESIDEQFGWVKLNSGGVTGWVASQYLIQGTKNQTAQVNQTYQVTVDHLNIRTEPNLSSAVIGEFNQGTKISAEKVKNGWVQTTINGQTVWVSGDFLAKSEKAAASTVSTANKSKKFTPATGNLSGKTIVLDAGHGGADPGSIALDKSYEKNLTLRVSYAVADQLRALGAEVVVTRSDDNTVSLVERAQLSQDVRPDAFVSIHYNAHTSAEGNGISTHFANQNGSEQLAENIQSAFTYYTPFADRGIRQNNYYVLTYNDSPAVLVELGFITNPNDLNQILSDSHPSSVSQAISGGITNYLN